MTDKIRRSFWLVWLIVAFSLSAGCVQEAAPPAASAAAPLVTPAPEMDDLMEAQKAVEERLAVLETEVEVIEDMMDTESHEGLHPAEPDVEPEAVYNEDVALATMDEVTAWLDHFVIRREQITLGDKANIHVHVSRRDTLDEIWDGKITVTFGDDKIERSIPVSNRGDDHYDYLFDTTETGTFKVTGKIFDDLGVLDSMEGEIVVS